MNLSFRSKFAMAVAWQFLLLFALLASRWTVLASGATAILDTMPVDPRDMFRGEYVDLRYEISSLDLNRLDRRDRRTPAQAGDRLFVVIAPSSKRLREPWRAAAIYDRAPTREELDAVDRNAVFLRGTVARRSGSFLQLAYGIESYFVPDGDGRRIERLTGGELTVEVKVDTHGRAVIRRLLRDGRSM